MKTTTRNIFIVSSLLIAIAASLFSREIFNDNENVWDKYEKYNKYSKIDYTYIPKKPSDSIAKIVSNFPDLPVYFNGSIYTYSKNLPPELINPFSSSNRDSLYKITALPVNKYIDYIIRLPEKGSSPYLLANKMIITYPESIANINQAVIRNADPKIDLIIKNNESVTAYASESYDYNKFLNLLKVYLIMILGMFAKQLFDFLKREKDAGNDTINIGSFLKKGLAGTSFYMALTVSPMIFIAIKLLLKDDLNTIESTVISFQNGFFWYSLFDKTSSSYKTPNG